MKTTISTIIFALFCFAALQAQNTEKVIRYHWAGLVNNKYPVDVCIEKKDSILQGQIIYTKSKNKTPIRLIGWEYGDKQNIFHIQEMLPDGTISGVITGQVEKTGGFEGTWFGGEKIIDKGSSSYKYIEGKEYTVRLMPSKETVSQTFSWKINKDNGMGTYSYSFGELLNMGKLELYKKNGKLLCTINANTSAPNFNMATIEEQECVWKDGRFIVNNGCAEESCEFEIIPFSDFVIINQIEGDVPCGFGLNATVIGIYLKNKK